MTPAVESFVLPALFLSVVLLGAIRPGAAVTLQPPSLASLVAAVALVAALVRSGTIAPERLMSPTRSALANTNGLTLLLTAFLASAQVVALVVPDSGVPALIGWTVMCALLLQTLAIGPDRTRLLRGLLVTFGVAFTLKFIVLANASAPATSRTGRALQLLFEGITLGSISQRVPHPVEGYLAFGTILLYLIGVAWLPSASWRMTRVVPRRALSDGRPAELEE